MRVEIDLPNHGSQILPGMYAYGEVIVERPDVLALPKSAITHAGGKSFIWRYVDGHAERTEIQTGPTDGEWIAVTNRHLKTKSPLKEKWVPIETSDQVLIGSKLSTLTDGGPVRLSRSPAPIAGESEQSGSDEAGGG